MNQALHQPQPTTSPSVKPVAKTTDSENLANLRLVDDKEPVVRRRKRREDKEVEKQLQKIMDDLHFSTREIAEVIGCPLTSKARRPGKRSPKIYQEEKSSEMAQLFIRCVNCIYAIHGRSSHERVEAWLRGQNETFKTSPFEKMTSSPLGLRDVLFHLMCRLEY